MKMLAGARAAWRWGATLAVAALAACGTGTGGNAEDADPGPASDVGVASDPEPGDGVAVGGDDASGDDDASGHDEVAADGFLPGETGANDPGPATDEAGTTQDAVSTDPGAADEDLPGTDGGTDPGTDPGEEPLMSTLPPWDRVGAEWVWTYQASGSSYTETQWVESVGTDDDGVPLAEHRANIGGMVSMTLHYRMGNGEIGAKDVTSNGLLTTYEPPLILLKVPLYAGDSWQQDVYVTSAYSGWGTRTVTVTGQETVTVAAGTFDCVKLHVVQAGVLSSDETDEWWSESVGLVKRGLYDFRLFEFSIP